jgi:nucleotide-binding universal stress UspA family protein
MPYEAFLAILVGINLVFAALSAFLASRWGREPFGWLLVGAILGPIGFVLLLLQHLSDRTATRTTLASPGAPTTPAGPKVLIAVDGSPFGQQAVEHVVAQYGPSLGEANVVGVLAIERAEGLSSDEDSSRRKLLEQEVENHLGEACSVLQRAGIGCKGIIRFGDPASEILKLAEEIGATQIVMGRRGRGGAKKLLLGSVSEKVSKEAPCPVTIVG